jgi:branched-chain amino acid transport system substrate-binding protein
MKTLFKAGIALSMGVALAGTAHADITIATAGPMTGQYASFGAQMKAGAEQAVEDINAAGGVLGQKLVLEVGDDACDPKQAVAVANQMAQGHQADGRPLLLGIVDPGIGCLR